MLATALSAFVILYLALGVAWFSHRRVGYSQVRHTISELGEWGAADGRRVAFCLFFPVGLLALSVALMLARTNPPLATLAACLAIGYLVAVVFPCDAGSPWSGSFRQVVHNLGGAVQYVGGGLALLAMEERTPNFRAVGFAVLACTVVIALLPARAWRGLVQRLAEVLLFGALLAGTCQSTAIAA